MFYFFFFLKKKKKKQNPSLNDNIHFPRQFNNSVAIFIDRIAAMIFERHSFLGRFRPLRHARELDSSSWKPSARPWVSALLLLLLGLLPVTAAAHLSCEQPAEAHYCLLHDWNASLHLLPIALKQLT